MKSKSILALLFLIVPVLNAAGSPLWGDLKPGPYAVGFRTKLTYDYSRTFRLKWTYDGKRNDAERARPIQIAVWYPAEASNKPAMRFEEYVWLGAQELSFEPLTSESRKRSEAQFVGERVTFTQAKAASAEALFSLSTAAVADATAKKGSFPLVIFAPGSSGTSFSDSVLCEYLASNGYIVAGIPSLGQYSRNATVDQVGFLAYMQDIEFAISSMHEFPNLDFDRTAIVGFSMGGSAATLVQMRNTDIDAAVYLDTGTIFSIVDGWFRPIPFYNRADLRAPQLYFTHKAAEGRDKSALDAMPYADRYLFLFRDGFRHTDFVADGIYPSAVPSYYSNPRTEDPGILYQAVASYTLQFLNAYLQNDSSAKEYLARKPEQNGLPAALVTAEFHQKIAAAPREIEFMEIVRSEGVDKGRGIFLQFQKTNPTVPLFREATLNSLGYELLFSRRGEESIRVFELNVEAFPHSANAHDSLSEAYERIGNKTLASDNAKKTIALLEKDTVMEEQRRAGLRRIAEERLKRLQ